MSKLDKLLKEKAIIIKQIEQIESAKMNKETIEKIIEVVSGTVESKSIVIEYNQDYIFEQRDFSEKFQSGLLELFREELKYINEVLNGAI